jgi:hypothetical protein
MITDETVDDILSGKIKLPPHPSRRKPPQPKSRQGRPRKHPQRASAPAGE